jgi:hypothetical protein
VRRLRPVLVLALIVVDIAILIGTPFLERLGELPRSLAYAFTHFGTNPAASALPLVRLLLGVVILAAIIDLMRAPRCRPAPGEPANESSAADRSDERPSVSMAVRDRWHDLPEWTWVAPDDVRGIRVGDTTWLVNHFSITIGSTIDFDEALRRIEIHDAFRQLAEDPDDVARRRAVVTALSAGKHWPFLGSSSFALSTMRILADRGQVLAGLFVLSNQGNRGNAPDDPLRQLSYLVAPTTAATALVENDPDRVVALVDQLGSELSDRTSDHDLQRGLAAAVALLTPAAVTELPRAVSSSPPAQEAVFRIQQADQDYVVTVARIDRLQVSGQLAKGFPVDTPFEQVTAAQEPEPEPEPGSGSGPEPDSDSDSDSESEVEPESEPEVDQSDGTSGASTDR